jgi:tRNA 2-thiocytidine biosynthesis protein TtcA
VDLLACNLDQGQPGFPATVLPEFLTGMGVPHRIEYRDTYSIVTEKVPEGSTYCTLCSRLRRGHVLRPLAHVTEKDCHRFARAMGYPIIPCDLCGSQDALQRREVKRMLDDWEAASPGRRQILFRALTQATPSHLLDPALFDFRGL